MHLAENGSEQTLQHLHQFKHLIPRHSMRSIGDGSYTVGKHYLVIPTAEQSSTLGHYGNMEVFTRLMKHGILYHSIQYKRSSSGKRCNTYCCFRDSADALCFGKIELFVKTPRLCVFVRQLHRLGTTLISSAGHPCRMSLSVFANADLLNNYIVPINMISTDLCPLLVLSISDIVSKVVLISVHNNHYCIIQPNSIERH